MLKSRRFIISITMIGLGKSLVVVMTALVITAAQECIPRDYGNGGTVCVCNATYCDETEPVPLFPPRQYYLYTSSKDGHRFNLTKKNFVTVLKTKGIALTLETNVTYQKVEGFGAAFTDSFGINILDLSSEVQEKLLSSYFGPRGSGYTIGRVPIGGSDFSTRPYTLDDYEFDVGFSKFNLTEEDHQYKIPFIKRSLELSNGTLRLLAAAWTAPPWMKTNEDYTGFGFLKEDYYRAWSTYHIRFLEEYEKHGLKIWALSTGNEPLNGAIPFFPFNCMGWTPQSQRTWVSKHMGPSLQRSRFNDTILIALDDQRFELPWWLNILFQDDEASPFIAGVGVHWYWDHIAPPILLDKTHEAYPDKFIISTEACFTKKAWEKSPVHLGSWARGEQYADNIIDDMNHWVAGWVDWNLALDENGGPNWADNVVDAAVIVNKTADEFYKQPMFYALAHFSKFVPPGSMRVKLTGTVRGIKAVAFLTPQDFIVIVILNKKNTDEAVKIIGAPRGYANFIVPRKSITTFIARDKKPPMFKLLNE